MDSKEILKILYILYDIIWKCLNKSSKYEDMMSENFTNSKGCIWAETSSLVLSYLMQLYITYDRFCIIRGCYIKILKYVYQAFLHVNI